MGYSMMKGPRAVENTATPQTFSREPGFWQKKTGC